MAFLRCHGPRHETYQGTDARYDEKVCHSFEIALVLLRLDHAARFIVNANHGIV